MTGEARGEGPKVKICGMTRPVDVRTAVAAGASHVGAVLVPGSPRRVTAEEAGTLGGVATVPLVVVVADLSASVATRVAETAGAGVIQLHGTESETLVRELRTLALGRWELWKAVRVRSAADISGALDRFGPWVDLLLLDGWHPTELGGTGTRFPWTALETLRDRIADEGPLLGAAGGLTPENVGEAVRRLDPDLVDVSSGVEVRPGIKDPDRVRAFVQEAVGARAGKRS